MPARRHAPGAFTLVEMILAMVVVSFLVLSLQSVMLLLSRSTPAKTGFEAPVPAAAMAADLLESDLAYASAVTTTGARAIELTVPDQTGDGQSETIRYEWSGTAGTSLTRIFNGQASTLVDDVREFSLAYDRTSTTRATTYSESSEIQLAGYDNLLALTTIAVSDSLGIAQYFLPSLPSAAVSWRPTRVLIKMARKAGGAGLTRIELCRAVSQQPSAIIDETMVLETNLGTTTQWQQFSFGSCPTTPKGSGLCLVLERISDPEPCQVQYQLAAALSGNTWMLTTGNAGTSWSVFPTQSICFYVYGVYQYADPVVTDYQLNAVRYTLRVGTDARHRLTGSARVYTSPTVAAP